MKTAIIFALIGIGLCSDEPYRCSNAMQNELRDDPECLKKTIEKFSDVLRSFGSVFCKYIKHQVQIKEELYAEAKKYLREFTGCVGCLVPLPLAEEVGTEVGVVAGEGLHDFAHLLEALHISVLPASLICCVGYPLFFSDCLDELLMNNPTHVIACLHNASNLAEKAEPDKAEAAFIAYTMNNTGCWDFLDTIGLEKLINCIFTLGREQVKNIVDGIGAKLISTINSLDPNIGKQLLDEIEKIPKIEERFPNLIAGLNGILKNLLGSLTIG